MLEDGGAVEVGECLGDGTRRHRLRSEEVEDAAAGGVRERLEHGIVTSFGVRP